MGEAHGLIISYSSTIGWSITTLNEGAKAFVAENGKQGAFILTREQHKPPEPPKMPVEPLTARTGKTDGGEPENGTEDNTEGGDTPDKPKQSTRKYICPKCGCIIRATRDVHVVCSECNVAFVKEQKNNSIHYNVNTS